MTIVAVAGGTGQLGRAIVDAIVADGKYQVLILSRKADSEKAKDIGVPIVAADYGDVDALVSTLESHNVHTIISTILTVEGSDHEITLIRAAEQSSVTKRYVNSFWATDYPAEFRQSFHICKHKCDAIEVLETVSSLEWTAIRIGYLLDYYVSPGVKSYIGPQAIFVDAANNAAAIPGPGDVPISFIHSHDVALFVAASLHLPKWEKATYIVGSKATWNQLVKLLEEAKGVKFKTVHDSIESLEAGKLTPLPSQEGMFEGPYKDQLVTILSTNGLIFAKGGFDLNPSHTLADDFPKINTRTIAELVKEAWGQH
ncbi:hypothetical protein ACHAPT_008317 [Fusarium lateritium]